MKVGTIMKKRKLNIKKAIISSLVLITIVFAFATLSKQLIGSFKSSVTYYLASSTNEVPLYDEELKEVKKKYRGNKINIFENKFIKKDNKKYMEIKEEGKTLYIDTANLVKNSHDVVLEKELYVQVSTSLLKDISDIHIVSLAKKGSQVNILDYDKLNDKGLVNMYKVKIEDNEGYIYAKYLVDTEKEAQANYEAETYDKIHSKIKNSYNGGNAINLDYYPVEKPKFDNNKMPDSVYSLYLNSGKNVIKNIDKYIEFAKDTKINTFVVDIIDDSAIGYASPILKELSPTSYKYANNTVEEYKEAITKLKEAGFYVIGRITAFKATHYVKDHPENSIKNVKTNEPYLHSKAYWPTPYSREVWYYDVSLAKEAVELMGFNEINFDYVRFPDKMTSIEKNNQVDLGNTYNEEKAQAIQRFLQYATDELHKSNVYVSVDVFGESTNGTYVTAYGQYWPAISNVVDVISGMPYPDHFSKGYYGIDKPWNHPYELMTAWAKDAAKRQKETTSPAIVRTWIQAFNVQSYVDPNGIAYEAEEIEKQVTALFEQGLKGGYITWLSSSNLDKYKIQKKAFAIDYLKEVK